MLKYVDIVNSLNSRSFPAAASQ